VPVQLDEALLVAAERPDGDDLFALDEALTRLAAIDLRQSRIVELRCFVGLTINEAAAVLSVSPTTVKDDFNLAKAWLRRELGRVR
jgi:DNA-directed RNA polymerase specialized sigma24 family protein